MNPAEMKKPQRSNVGAFENVIILEKNHMANSSAAAAQIKPSARICAATGNHSFEMCGGGNRLFQVTPGIPVEDALESASCILSEMKDYLVVAADGDADLSKAACWLLLRLTAEAKAVIDGLNAGLEDAA